MNPLMQVMTQRASVRAFTNVEPSWSEVRDLVESAAQAASSKNTQPWTLHLLRGEALESLRRDYLQAFDEGRNPEPSYEYAPEPLPQEWKDLARECGFGIFNHKGITREDREGRQAHNRENFEFFKAPGLFILSTRSDAGLGNFLDCGLFLQNLMLGLDSLGLGSCPQFSAVSYPDILQKHCRLTPGESQTFICGLAFGVPDSQAHVNQFKTTRRPLDSWFYEYGDQS